MTTESAAGVPAPAIRAVAVLEDDLRRGMYSYVRGARRPVTREEAAAAVGISRKLAAFHLDKLVEADLLRARCEASAGVRKPGRTPKVYEPTDTEIRISIPRRSPEVLASILLEAVRTERAGETARTAALRVAGEHGERLGTRERERQRPGRLGAERALTLAGDVLERQGFEPSRECPTSVRLRNCPFQLPGHEPELVCRLNHAFLSGFLTGLHAPSVRAEPARSTGECCVALTATPGS
jgi:predicted ArsR family transcriptional regulator